jgi:hypothetical protein
VIPILGVLLDGWDAAELVLFFFAETAVVGVFNVARILLARGEPSPDENPQDRTGFFSAPFFVAHYGFFLAIQWAFLRGMVASDALWSLEFARDLGVVAVFEAWDLGYHGIYRRQRFRVSPMRQMFLPYPRIVVQQFLVLLGGWMAILGGLVGGTPAILYLIVLVALRTAFDVLVTPVWMEALVRPEEAV